MSFFLMVHQCFFKAKLLLYKCMDSWRDWQPLIHHHVITEPDENPEKQRRLTKTCHVIDRWWILQKGQGQTPAALQHEPCSSDAEHLKGDLKDQRSSILDPNGDVSSGRSQPNQKLALECIKRQQTEHQQVAVERKSRDTSCKRSHRFTSVLAQWKSGQHSCLTVLQVHTSVWDFQIWCGAYSDSMCYFQMICCHEHQGVSFILSWQREQVELHTESE